MAEYEIMQNPFGTAKKSENINQGVVEIESNKAVAEAQGKLVIAKRFPRDEFAAFEKLMKACSRQSLAEKAIYSYPRSGNNITGPSIRLAEEAARCWGNVDFGVKELSQKEGESEMMAYCWDMETNVMSSQQFVVHHVMDTKKGVKKLTEQRDIYENSANMAGRRLRARILAILPPDLIEAALAKCRETLAGSSDIPLEDRIRKMIAAFEKISVRRETLEKRMGHDISKMTIEELVEHLTIYNSIKDGSSKISDWFDHMSDDKKTRSINDKLEDDKNAN
ncbi:MAG: hypothetical protein K2H01_03260 [Ruminococcus sp.]|nr:hypothetical protein [Ruminococcus sp.]